MAGVAVAVVIVIDAAIVVVVVVVVDVVIILIIIDVVVVNGGDFVEVNVAGAVLVVGILSLGGSQSRRYRRCCHQFAGWHRCTERAHRCCQLLGERGQHLIRVALRWRWH